MLALSKHLPDGYQNWFVVGPPLRHALMLGAVAVGGQFPEVAIGAYALHVTMLYSLYPREGIVFAADSRIIRPGTGRAEPPQPKILRVRRAGVSTGLIGYYGLAEVDGQRMSAWLSTLIGRWPGSHDPEVFAALVVQGLNRDTKPRERRVVSGLHFGAFRRTGGRTEPVFFHIFQHAWVRRDDRLAHGPRRSVALRRAAHGSRRRPPRLGRGQDPPPPS